MRAWKSYAGGERVPLPRATPGARTVEEVLAAPRPGLARGAAPRVTLGELATLLRKSYGPTGAKPMRGRPDETQYYRASASSGGLYPIEIYPIVHDVAGAAAGIYHYDVHAHELEAIERGDFRRAVADALWGGAGAGDVTLALCAVLPRTMSKYQFRGYRFALYDTGALLGSLTANAAAAGLGAEVVDGFVDDAIAALVGADRVDEQAVALVALGAPAPANER
jgi:SagB-type dehydrogenase family enzyme